MAMTYIQTTKNMLSCFFLTRLKLFGKYQMDCKSILVIGGASVIGSSIINEARNGGYKVTTTSRSGADGSIPLDVTNDENVRSSVLQAIHQAGKIDALVYLPAITDTSLTHSADISSWQAVYDVNVLGALRVTKELLPHFMRQRDGVCLYVSSTAAVRGMVGSAAYAASKAALNSFAKSISKEYGRFNIRAFTVMPGYVNGGMLKDMAPQRVQELSKSIALRRFAHVDEIARFTVALLGFPYLNGTELSIDGGIND
ncbi:SDR family NAD(P)-dependent oxidoreductase [Chromobacterium phragmitis]|uniref:Ketoreductase domain-containing protein n=1 Tax=Chromobacterium phragmitis TaxID=2202141 RepID=A0A344ULT7_9NEIS|nr:SDR family oxidoreductase [Chromobacterium phragmitis]AXE36235.1 hypothetical protein DK843_19210 [Chromobacterium phragmitis]